jgi:hypothetical protein
VQRWPVPTIALFLLVGSLAVACQAPNDAPIPAGYGDLVEGARASLEGNLEGIFSPGLAFVEIHCFANGGHVVIFRQVGGPNPGESAWTIQGRGAGVDGWGGGVGEENMNEEIACNFAGDPKVACPPR